MSQPLQIFLAPLVVLIALGTSSVHAADRPARTVPQPAIPVQLDPGHSETDVILKFVDETPIRWVDGRLAAVGSRPADLTAIDNLLQGTTVTRLFSRSVDELDNERAELQLRVPADRPLLTDLNQYYRVVTAGAEATVALVEALLALPSVETAYPELSPEALVPLGGDLAPATGLFESGQGYLGPAPIGLGYDDVRTIVGVRAPDLMVAHLEASWHFDHEDSCQMELGAMIGAAPLSYLDSWKDHGSAVAGVLAADRNGYGVRGMSGDATLRLGSFQIGTADMISLATAVAAPGDVFITSAAFIVQGQYHAPLDFQQAEFDAILAAATKGVVYCFGSGNTNNDLGDVSIYGTRYAPGAPDSGGVIVGAGESTSLDKSSFSNYGDRVDCHAWGDSIWTLGYGSLFNVGDPKQLYADDFSGTSGSGPQVAGLAAAISNVVREQNGTQLDAFEIRELLRTIGTPQGAGGPVGVRPDLEAILASQGLPDGLVIAADGVIGQQVSVQLSGAPSTPIWLFVSPGRGQVGVGLNRNFLLDPVGLVSFSIMQLDQAGQLTVSRTLPNQPSLMGASVYLQAAELGPVKRLTNSAELWIQG